MGAFELEPFAAGTRAVAEAVAAAAGHDRRRRRRLGRRARSSSGWPTGHAPVDRRRRGARADRGQARCPGVEALRMSPRRGRTPLIAGNWKMHKTVAEAEEFIQALLPRVSTADGVDVAICPPFLRSAAMVDSTRGSRVQVFAQNMHHERRAARSPARCRAPMLVELGVHGVILGHSERRELFGETDRALALKVPAALDAGLVPILCVGETEEERERGDTERKLRHQVQEDLARVADRAARRRRDRLRADLGDRHRPGGDARAGPGGDRVHPRAGRPTARASRPSGRASSTAAASSPTTRPSCWRCPTSTARSSAAPASTPSRSRRSSPPRR